MSRPSSSRGQLGEVARDAAARARRDAPVPAAASARVVVGRGACARMSVTALRIVCGSMPCSALYALLQARGAGWSRRWPAASSR